MLSTSLQSPAGSTCHCQKQWQDSSRSARAGCKEESFWLAKWGRDALPVFQASSIEMLSKSGQARNFSPLLITQTVQGLKAPQAP